jgi:hypothetical protein
MDLELEKMIKDIRKAANIPEDDIEFNREIGMHVFKYSLNQKLVDEIANKGMNLVRDIIASTIQGRVHIAENNFGFTATVGAGVPQAETNNIPDIQDPPIDWFWVHPERPQLTEGTQNERA